MAEIRTGRILTDAANSVSYFCYKLILLIKLPITDQRLEVLVDRFGEDGYRVYLERLRWPEGVRCPRCSSARIAWLDARAKHNCRECRYQFRVTAGTLLHDSTCRSGRGSSPSPLSWPRSGDYPATQLQELIGGSYKTAWFVEHRIRAAMAGLGHIGPIVALRTGCAARDGIAQDLPAGWRRSAPRPRRPG